MCDFSNEKFVLTPAIAAKKAYVNLSVMKTKTHGYYA